MAPGVVVFLLVFLQLGFWVSANVVFQVHHKFTGNEKSLSVYKDHDSYRHRRILSAADLPIGGNGSPSSAALYYTTIQIGTPPRDYHVQVDTGSDLLWVNCAGCESCPRRSDLGITLMPYDPRSSSSSRMITCDQNFCTSTLASTNNNCISGMRCSYLVKYGDGSSTTGYFVRDTVQLNRVSGNLQTDSMHGRITFGCGARQYGGLGSSQQAVDGILGFGQANSSLLSQLAAAKKVKKTFSHCLAGSKGGGIFAIGEVVEPKVQTTPMMPHEAHFNIELLAIKVGDHVIDFPEDIYESATKRGSIVDSGSTLAYFPDAIYNELMSKIMYRQPYIQTHIVDEQFRCFKYHGDIDENFPMVSFHFANQLALRVHPHQYLFQTHNKEWCFGFLSNGNPREAKDTTILLGDAVLSDKLVTYNMEDQTIGWTDYNCSSSIKVKDEESGRVYEVGAHDISSSEGHVCGPLFMWLVFIVVVVSKILVI